MVLGRVKPQQNNKSVMEVISFSPKEGNHLVLGLAVGVLTVFPSWSLSFSSSSITNWGSVMGSPSSVSASLFHSNSDSNVLESPWASKTTGKTRWRMRKQFRTSLVVFLSGVALADLMKEDAYAATDTLVAEGNVWSEIRLNSREVTTRISVAMFSGASERPRRTKQNQKLIYLWATTCALWWGVMSENTSDGESNSTKYCGDHVIIVPRSRK